MSQDLRKERSGDGDISRTATEGKGKTDEEGFEGMNYEQFRQPYHPKNKEGNSSTNERNNSKRPEES